MGRTGLRKRNNWADHPDPHMNDGWGPVPRVPPGYQKPPDKVEARWVWPRDKNRGSWGRIKDLMTGKGPDMYISRSDQYAPTKATWSNWTGPMYDSLGFREESDVLKSTPRQGKYDFRSRRYTKNWMNDRVWSDVKWEPRKNPDIPMYRRNCLGDEYALRTEFMPAAWRNPAAAANARRNNDFRYDPYSQNWNWTHPNNSRAWRQHFPSPSSSTA